MTPLRLAAITIFLVLLTISMDNGDVPALYKIPDSSTAKVAQSHVIFVRDEGIIDHWLAKKIDSDSPILLPPF